MDAAPRSHTAFLRDPDLPFVESRDTRIAGSPFGTHTHETYSVSVVQEGATLLGCRGGQWLMGPGAAVFFPPGEPHACNPQPGQTLKYRKFYLERGWFEGQLARARSRLTAPAGPDDPPGGPARPDARDHAGLPGCGEALAFDPAVPAVLDDGDAAQAFLRFGRAQDQGASGAEKLALLEDALEKLFTCRETVRLSGGPPRAERRAATLAARMIAARATDRISLSEMAAACGVSACHLPRVFREAYAVTPHAYQNQLRVELAKRMLAGGTPIAQVSAEAGFADQSHLNRVFRRYTGATPRQYMLGSRR
ncbi:AraC family transcriptional regulator [Fundidesulfovibrio terrae]|uniref:AraC family transcriptional regulator n=1 Tax=Fundidesulfovibrio terrae TaxID=2922866 RepID=UPI001FAF72AC|nr:AraC family transcriptional regulator [Fundidesulfovibrio terrae]